MPRKKRPTGGKAASLANLRKGVHPGATEGKSTNVRRFPSEGLSAREESSRGAADVSEVLGAYGLDDPEMPTPATAATYVKIRAAGLPPDDAVRSFLPAGQKWTRKQIHELARAWEDHPRVEVALAAFNGAAWLDMDNDRRVALALERTNVQYAYYLMTANFADPYADVKKIEAARTALLAKIEAEQAKGAGDKFTELLRQILDGGKSLDAGIGAMPRYRAPLVIEVGGKVN